MEMTFEKICQKLGFNPLTDDREIKCSGHEDDSQPSPYSKLTFEESEFLYKYLMTHRK